MECPCGSTSFSFTGKTTVVGQIEDGVVIKDSIVVIPETTMLIFYVTCNRCQLDIPLHQEFRLVVQGAK